MRGPTRVIREIALIFIVVMLLATVFVMAARVRVALGAEFRHSTAFYRYQWLEARERIDEQRRAAKVLRVRNRQLRVRWQPHVRTAIALASVVYRQPEADMLRVANCETGGTLSPYAKNRSSSASGLYQFLYPSTWNSTPFARFSVWDPYVSAMAAGWMWANGRRGEWVCR
jgi:hypothetical protein